MKERNGKDGRKHPSFPFPEINWSLYGFDMHDGLEFVTNSQRFACQSLSYCVESVQRAGVAGIIVSYLWLHGSTRELFGDTQ